MTTNTTTTATGRYDYVNVGGTALDRPTAFEIHGEGCQDVARLVKAGASVCTISAPSARTLVAWEVEEMTAQEQGWTAEDFRILPCCAAQDVGAALDAEEVEARQDGTVTAEVAQAELDRRKANKAAKRTGAPRQEVADTDAARDAFEMGGPALKALAAS